jgi:hypothetical protein
MIGGEHNLDSIIGEQALGDRLEHDVIHGGCGSKYQFFLFFLHLILFSNIPSRFSPIFH